MKSFAKLILEHLSCITLGLLAMAVLLIVCTAISVPIIKFIMVLHPNY